MYDQSPLKFADEIVFAETGEHLDDLQVGIIDGVLKRKTYGEIAQEYKCTEKHVKDISYALWQVLSDGLDEKVGKKNLKSALERRGNLNIWRSNNHNTFSGSNSVNNNINYVGRLMCESPQSNLTAPKAKTVTVNDGRLNIELLDDRLISVPLNWFPQLLNATPYEQQNWQLIKDGESIRWPDLGQEITVYSLLAGECL
jgi:hypothetical protein